MSLSEEQREVAQKPLPLEFRAPSSVINSKTVIIPGTPIDKHEDRTRGNWSKFSKFTKNGPTGKDELTKIGRAIESSIPGVTFEIGDLKSEKVAQQKVMNEKSGKFRKLTDYVRGRFYADTPEQISAIVNYLYENHLAQIIESKDGFTQGSTDPKFKAVLSLESAEDMASELQIRHRGMMGCDKKTHPLYGCGRNYVSNIQKQWGIGSQWDPSRTGKIVGRISKERLRIIDAKVKELGLGRLRVEDYEQHFFAIKRKENLNEWQPVMIMPDPYREGKPLIAVIPDYETGLFLKDTKIVSDEVLQRASKVGVATALSERFEVLETVKQQFLAHSWDDYQVYQIMKLEAQELDKQADSREEETSISLLVREHV